jgi:hypothetical protein
MSPKTKSAPATARKAVPEPATARAQQPPASIRQVFSTLDGEVLLTEAEAAVVVGFTAQTLKKWRLYEPKLAPVPTYLYGSVRYSAASVRNWLKAFPSEIPATPIERRAKKQKNLSPPAA